METRFCDWKNVLLLYTSVRGEISIRPIDIIRITYVLRSGTGYIYVREQKYCCFAVFTVFRELFVHSTHSSSNERDAFNKTCVRTRFLDFNTLLCCVEMDTNIIIYTHTHVRAISFVSTERHSDVCPSRLNNIFI